jgi:pilus assembly protein FimV
VKRAKITDKGLVVRYQKTIAKSLVMIKHLVIQLGCRKKMANLLAMLKLLGVAVALTLSTGVSAVGLGGINVASALGQRLKADIQLMSLNKDEKSSLVARLAAPDVYKGAGLEYPYGNKFKFEVESRAGGEYYLKVSSAEPVNDPFVSLLVELSWSSGKLLREYTFLLDPPDYVPEQPKQAEVQAVAPAVQSAPLETRPVEQAAQAAAARAESKAVDRPVEKPAIAPSARHVAAESTDRKIAAGNITVQRGDTLNKIAAQNKPAEISLERMLVALYRANADQFDGKNMNRIKIGRILRLPDQNELNAVSQSGAVAEIHTQVADWNAYRQKLAGAAVASSQPQAPKQAATGKITASVADKAPVAKESAKEVLKLSKGETPGDKAAAGAGGKPMSAQDKKNAAQEEAIAKAKALKEDQARAALLEKNLKDMQRLAQLKSEELARMKADADAQAKSKGKAALTAPAAVSGVGAASAVAAASEVKPAQVAKPKPSDKPKVVVQQEPSLVDQILGEPLYLAGGAAALLGLGGLGFALNRRRKASSSGASESSGDVGSTTATHIAAPVPSSPDTGDFTALSGAHAAEAAPSDDIDPISEADLFLSFGRDGQAEEILKEALQRTPNNHQLHLKLLGIYANRQDVNSFSVIAHQLQGSGDEEAWQQAAAMGRKLEPDNPMYSGAGAVEDAGSAATQIPAVNAMPDFVLDDMQAVQETPGVDIDLGAPDEQANALLEPDFLAEAEKTMVMTPADMAVSQATPMDFDITSIDASLSASSEMDLDITSTGVPVSTDATAAEAAVQTEADLSSLDDLVFDVTSVHPSISEAQQEAAKPSEAAPVDDEGMAFTLDFPVEEGVAEKPEPVAVDTGLAGITLNLDEETAPAEPVAKGVAAETKDQHWQEVATKIDLARAYQEMGDVTGAREILNEVLVEGDAEQRETAQAMIDQLLV